MGSQQGQVPGRAEAETRLGGTPAAEQRRCLRAPALTRLMTRKSAPDTLTTALRTVSAGAGPGQREEEGETPCRPFERVPIAARR